MKLNTTIDYSGCSTDDVRFVDGKNEFEGRVEICRNGIWGAVRDSTWDYYDAVVTCNQLGYPSNCMSGSLLNSITNLLCNEIIIIICRGYSIAWVVL